MQAQTTSHPTDVHSKARAINLKQPLYGVSFAKSLCPAFQGYLPVWRTLFGLGLQADSSTGERCSPKT
jgi:hypothetical protein